MSFIFLSKRRFTGGPLALHQAASRMNALGGRASVMYFQNYGRKQKFSLKREAGNIRSTLDVFRRWTVDERLKAIKVPAVGHANLEDNFVVPESFPELALQLLELGCPNVHFWWLSVDNFPLNSINLLSTQSMIRRCNHLCQSEYARDFAVKNGAQKVMMVSDVIDLAEPEGARDSVRKYDFAYLPAKTAGAEQLITQLGSKYNAVALKNMGRNQVTDALQSSKVFIDFGHHPGKDRVPREAALCGAIPMVRKVGAAGFAADVPLPEPLLVPTDVFFDFDAFDVCFQRVLQDAESLRKELVLYVKWISDESERFDDELRALMAFAEARTSKA